MRIVMTVAALAVSLNSATAAEWQMVSSKAGNFRVKMPGKPQNFSRKLNTKVGETEMHFYLATANNGKTAYLVMYNDYPSEFVAKADPKKVVEGAVKGSIRGRNGKVMMEKVITIDGYPGKMVVFEFKQGSLNMTAIARVYLVKNRLYQVLLMTETSVKPSAEDIDKYLTSFARLSK